jgi:hypothetical protein
MLYSQWPGGSRTDKRYYVFHFISNVRAKTQGAVAVGSSAVLGRYVIRYSLLVGFVPQTPVMNLKCNPLN